MGQVLELRDVDSGSTRTVRVGDEIVIRLAENPTTGYAWEFHQSGDGALRTVDNKYESAGPQPGRPLPGAGGQRVLRLVGERAGKVQLEAVHRRPWDPPASAEQRRVFTVIVQ
jgi:inhibitor of cysteine peptidase